MGYEPPADVMELDATARYDVTRCRPRGQKFLHRILLNTPAHYCLDIRVLAVELHNRSIFLSHRGWGILREAA